MNFYDPKIAQSVTATAQQVLIPMIQNLHPATVAQTILGVQPMTGIGTGRSILFIQHEYDNIVWSKKKYKFSRAKWYIATFKNGSKEMHEWCIQHFGPHPRKPDAWNRWFIKGAFTIYLRDEADYILFTLRWS